LSFWDFAAAAPYVKIEMHPVVEGPDAHLAYKDAIFISPHKFIGGPGTPGVLIAKRALFQNRVPVIPGGGTVAYVNKDVHLYIADPEIREEGGTPAIVESIRAGLVFQLKEAVGHDTIHQAESGFIKRAITSWDANPHIDILGNHDAWRLSIVSFVVRHRQRYLHHAFVAALLNDLFGIQARSGCSCAGPYGHQLLQIDTELGKAFEEEILCGHQGIRPGWVRVNFNYFISETTFDFILQAMHLVANEGWKLLPQYRFDPDTGFWSHRAGRPGAAMRLTDLKYAHGRLEYRSRRATDPEWMLASYIDEAKKTFSEAATNIGQVDDPVLSADFEELRWFPLPGEVAAVLRDAEDAAAGACESGAPDQDNVSDAG
ncbi:MAG: aminotransferase class V-fold PLP-dependent enzyme, partial [Deltaproteobacteria bacterium]|nr:aminotransferase class V-fold PLP-dependent enzyme [Deltaproteobacteria bacterium]